VICLEYEREDEEVLGCGGKRKKEYGGKEDERGRRIGGRDEWRTNQVKIVGMKYINENGKANWIEELWIGR
jgi:hypothetical protein